jgi:hypothetical protein
MEYWTPCPEPGDKEGWRQWTKCHAIAAAVVIVLVVVIFILCKL